MDEFGIDFGITIDGPPGFEWDAGIKSGDVVPVRKWLDMLAYAERQRGRPGKADEA